MVIDQEFPQFSGNTFAHERTVLEKRGIRIEGDFHRDRLILSTWNRGVVEEGNNGKKKEQKPIFDFPSSLSIGPIFQRGCKLGCARLGKAPEFLFDQRVTRNLP